METAAASVFFLEGLSQRRALGQKLELTLERRAGVKAETSALPVVLRSRVTGSRVRSQLARVAGSQ